MSKKEKENRAKRCGEFLVEFVNAKAPDEARRDLLKSVRDEFKFHIFVGPPLSRAPLSESERNNVEENLSDLKQLFSEFEAGINISENKFLGNYLLCYDLCCKHPVTMDEDGHINKYPEIGEHSGYDQVLAYCLITFIESERNRKLIHKCRMCRNFFLSKKLGEHKFCSKKCRLSFHNRKRIESGEHARYKREGRKQGKYQ